MITLLQLNKIYPYAKNVTEYIDPINETLARFKINTSLDIALFLAQVGHESGQLRYTTELASGEHYEMRRDLGNIHPGDGPRYKGRGLIQITGRANYELLTEDFPPYDFIEEPELLAQPRLAALSAGWFWDKHKLNGSDLKHSTRVINGDYNGLEDRNQLYIQARKVLKC